MIEDDKTPAMGIDNRWQFLDMISAAKFLSAIFIFHEFVQKFVKTAHHLSF